MNKKTTSIIAVVVLLLLILTGTFAWTQYNQHKTNEANGPGLRYDVSLIEDFEEIENWKIDESYTKEIRVKNSGLTDGTYGDVYVRLQLKEYLEMAKLIYEYSEHRLMIDESGEFIKFDSQAEFDASEYGSTHTYDKQQGLEDEQEYWYVQTQAGDDNGQYGKFLLIDIDSEDAISLIDGVVRATDTESHDLATNGECEYTVHVWKEGSCEDCGLGFHEYIQWFFGEDVISIDEWQDDYDSEPVEKWIYDTDVANEEGWVYWGVSLAPGETTSNLLEKVKLIKQPDGNFYYALHVDMEAVSREEVEVKWTDAPAELRTVLTTAIVLDVAIETAAAEAVRGGTISFAAIVAGYNGASQEVTWTVSADTVIRAVPGNTTADGSTIDEDGVLYIAPGETANSLTITATSVDNELKYKSITIPVIGALVESITISPAAATVGLGEEQEFTATVNGVNGTPLQTVTWTVEGAKSDGTEFIGNTLHIGEDEELKTLTVVATSTYDKTKKGSAPVTVEGVVNGVTLEDMVVARNSSVTMAAMVDAVGNTPQAVTWTVSGGIATATEIDEVTGVLSIAADEPFFEQILTITATSVYDENQYDEATVTVTTYVGDVFTADNYTWKTIAKDGDNYLIHMTTRDGTSAFGSSNTYVGSTLETRMQTYNSATKLPILYQYMQKVDLKTESSYVTAWTEDGISKVDTTLGEETRTAFALSVSETRRYYASSAARKDALVPDGVSSGWGWWLRSPGTATGLAAAVITTGDVGGYSAFTTTYGVRAALWINTLGSES